VSLKPAGRGASKNPEKGDGCLLTWLPRLSWGVAILMVAFTGYMLFLHAPAAYSAFTGATIRPELTEAVDSPTEEVGETTSLTMPDIEQPAIAAVSRNTDPHTIIPDRPRSEASDYVVEKGDSIFGIAKTFGLKPATVLWANYDVLNANPNELSVGDKLRIPPTDGVFYKWKDGDTLQGIAGEFKANAKDILTWPGNHLDLLKPVVKPGTYVMVPGGWRPTTPWLIPTMWRANAGASRGIKAGCATGTGGAVGTSTFIWPAGNHYLSGNDYSEIHLGIDIAAGEGAPVFASDSGVVVWAAPIGGGYGNMIMIDHGNGYTTLYAHLSVFLVHCGASVNQGQRIAMAGSTGNSTGPHLHFEVRSGGAFINPWYVLP
jgi:murein DD-endopeptidase MepM/ murein hydrolase activator NlpD